MRIVQASPGKSHHHELSRQLSSRGVLERYFSGYPGWKLKGEDLPHARITTFPWGVVPYMAMAKTGVFPWALMRATNRLLLRSFDAFVARKLPSCDAFLALSGAGLKAGRRAQEQGGVFACSRGSSHIATQDHLLREEYGRYGVAFPGVDPWVIEREKAEYEQADMIHVPSEFVRQTFLDQGIPASKLAKIPYGVNLERFQKVGEPPRDSFEVVFVGSVSLRKGFAYLLKAFEAFSHPRKRLTVVGGLTSEIREYLAHRNVPDQVRFAGHCPQPRLKEILSRSHVMVLPSIEEGLARVIAQALACGCPVIASENTGASDLFDHGEAGFMTPIRAPEAIAEGLQCLADDPDRRDRMGEAGVYLTRHRLGGWDAFGESMVTELSRRAGVTQGEGLAAERVISL